MIQAAEASTEGLAKLKGALCCKHCGKPLMQSASGAVCEDWNCGGIQWFGKSREFAMSRDAAEKLASWLALPEASYVRTGFGAGHYTIAGIDGVWRNRKSEPVFGAIKCRRKPSKSEPMPVQHFTRIESQ